MSSIGTNNPNVTLESASQENPRNLQYLPLTRPNIRLISIDPSMQDGMLQVALVEAPLDDHLHFNVLSYVWGNPANKKIIMVNGQLLEVTPNLYDFLDTTRKHEPSFLAYNANTSSPRPYKPQQFKCAANASASASTELANERAYWWIDAICINQNDIEERNEQVPRMGDIYSMANRVWIWIGLPSKVFRSKRSDFEFAELQMALKFHAQDCAKIRGVPESGESVMDTPLIEQFARYQRDTIIQRTKTKARAMGYEIDSTDMFERYYDQFAELISPEQAYGFFNNFLEQYSSLLLQPYFGRTWVIQEFVLNPRTPVALLGRCPLDMDNLASLGNRVLDERSYLHDHVKLRVRGVLGAKLELLFAIRRHWHDLPHDSLTYSLPPIMIGVPRPDETFSRLPAGKKLNLLLRAFTARQCTNRHDHFYGILGLLNSRELPESLLPDYNLPFEEVSWRYTRYIIHSTGDIRFIESGRSLGAADYPSWVPDVKYLSPLFGNNVVVSQKNIYFNFSHDGRHLTLEGTPIGGIITCSCTACPTEFTDKHLEFVDEVLLEGASQITGKPLTEVFRSWLHVHMDMVGNQLSPQGLERYTSMQEILQRYREICSDIPLDVQEIFNNVPVGSYHLLADTPCRDPEFLVAVLALSKLRYCLLSTGHVVMCGLKDTTASVSSPSHRYNDCTWAIKGLQQLAILRPIDSCFKYCGTVQSAKIFLKNSGLSHEHEFDLDEEFFAKREVQRIVLV